MFGYASCRKWKEEDGLLFVILSNCIESYSQREPNTDLEQVVREDGPDPARRRHQFPRQQSERVQRAIVERQAVGEHERAAQEPPLHAAARPTRAAPQITAPPDLKPTPKAAAEQFTATRRRCFSHFNIILRGIS